MKQRNVTGWDRAELALAHGASTLLLHGSPGVGKTSWARTQLDRICGSTLTLDLNSDISAVELEGIWIPGSTWRYEHGVALHAYESGCGLVVNELSRAAGSVLDLFLRLLDDSIGSAIDTHAGRRVERHPNFKVIATQNGTPDKLDPALCDRFQFIIPVDAPHIGIELWGNRIYKGLGTAIVRSYSDPDNAISPRGIKSFALLRDGGMTPADAANMVWGSRGEDLLTLAAAIAAEGGVKQWDTDCNSDLEVFGDFGDPDTKGDDL